MSARGQVNDARLMRRAVRNRWPVTEAARRSVIDFAVGVIEKDRGRIRDKVACSKILLEADKINIQAIAATKEPPAGSTNVTVNVDARQHFNLDPAAFAEFEAEVLGVVATDDQAKSIHSPSANGSAAAIPASR